MIWVFSSLKDLARFGCRWQLYSYWWQRSGWWCTSNSSLNRPCDDFLAILQLLCQCSKMFLPLVIHVFVKCSSSKSNGHLYAYTLYRQASLYKDGVRLVLQETAKVHSDVLKPFDRYITLEPCVLTCLACTLCIRMRTWCMINDTVSSPGVWTVHTKEICIVSQQYMYICMFRIFVIYACHVEWKLRWFPLWNWSRDQVVLKTV